jgi:transposase InsO family protein
MGARGYPAEFRRRVIDLVESGRKVAAVAADLGISPQTIYTWRRQDRIDRGLERGLSSAERAELVAAKKRIRELEIELVIHSDQGTQFTSWAFTSRAIDSGLVPSMGSVGDCYDNAVIESFWSRMQLEHLDRKRWRTRVELANAIFEYIKVFYNRQRRHSALGMLSPIEFEAGHQPTTAA